MASRLNPELAPERIRYAKQELEKKGLQVFENGECLSFSFNGHLVRFYPYTGWASGKSIKDGRGLKNLLKQIA